MGWISVLFLTQICSKDLQLFEEISLKLLILQLKLSNSFSYSFPNVGYFTFPVLALVFILKGRFNDEEELFIYVYVNHTSDAKPVK